MREETSGKSDWTSQFLPLSLLHAKTFISKVGHYVKRTREVGGVYVWVGG